MSRRQKFIKYFLAQRARIVLLAADGLSNVAVADRVGVNQSTVVKWRNRYLERGLEGLVDEPRPGDAAHDQRCGGRSGGRQDAGGHANRCDALVDA